VKLTRFENIASKFSPSFAVKRAKKRMILDNIRKYDGASRTKRNKNWRVTDTSKDEEVRGASKILRDRARDLYNNNPYAKRGVDVIVNNTIGSGIIPDFIDDNLEKQFKLWTSQSDYHGRSNFYSMQSLMMETIVRDGEVLIRRHRKRSSDGLALPLQIELIEPDFLALDKNGSLDNGNTIIMGVEYDSKNQRKAYHLYEERPGSLSFSNKTFRVSARNIIHGFKVERPNQSRGITWLHAIMQRLRDFDDWEDSQLIKMKLSTCFMGFIRESEVSDEEIMEEEEDYSLEPGTMKKLPPGTDIEFPDLPKIEGLTEYNKNVLHSIAVGLGITYQQLTNDLSSVNYSSIRAGHLEFQRNLVSWRKHTVYPILEEIIKWVIEAGNLQGIPGNSEYSFTPPRREMIDPVKEIPALSQAIRSGLMSWSEVQRAQGNDPEAKALEIQKDFNRFDKLKLVLDIDPRQVQKNGAIQKEDVNNED